MWLSHKCQPVSPQVPWTQKGTRRHGKEQHCPPKPPSPAPPVGRDVQMALTLQDWAPTWK